MSMEVDNNNQINRQNEIINAFNINTPSDKRTKKVNKTTDNPFEKEKDVVDTYKKNVVSESIEQKIQEQKAEIDEISKNLEGLREDYRTTKEAEDNARYERQLKARELYQKEVSESALQRIFLNWQKKHNENMSDKTIESKFKDYSLDYNDSVDARILADKDYDMADMDAFMAISEHNKADAAFLGGLWRKETAYWDLAKLQQRYAFAKYRESKFD